MISRTYFRIRCCAIFLFAAVAALGEVYDVRTFGAKGDGTAKDTAAVQRALDECAKAGGKVVVPAGTYLIGSIYLGDNTELHLEEGATLLGSPDLADYNEPDAYPQNWGSVREGWSAKHLILAIEKKNVGITGKGVIDGNGRAFFDSKPRHRSKIGWRHGGCNAWGKPAEQRRPGQEIVFVECRNVAVRDVMFKDMSCWSCLFHGCDGVVVGGVKVRNGFLNLNTDGFDIDSCSNVSVGDCDIETGDDAIAIRGNPVRLKNPEKACENVRVSNIVCRVQADGVRVGVGNGTIRNVRISDMKVLESGRALHVQCCYGNPKAGDKVGVDISDVVFERIDIKDTCEPISVMAGSAASTAILKDIAFREIRAESTLPPSIIGKGKTRPCNISFAGCSFVVGKTVPGSRAEDKFKLDAGGGKGAFVVDRADGLSIRNCSIRLFDTGAEVPVLATLKPGGWDPSVREKLNALIERNRGNPDAYVVFDFDYTTAMGDLSYVCMWHILERFAFKTDDYRMMFTDGVSPSLIPEANAIADIAVKLKPFAGTDLTGNPEWREFVRRYWRLYRNLAREIGEYKAYLWRVRLFTGYTPESLRALAREAIAQALAAGGGLRQDVNAPTEKRGLVITPEIKDLFNEFRKAGIAVYIVSGSFTEVLKAATSPDFGLDLPQDNVFGCSLKSDSCGRYMPEMADGGVKYGCKPEFIRANIAPRHHGAEPVLTAGDSMGDYGMLTEFKDLQLALVFRRKWKNPQMRELVERGGRVVAQGRDEVRGCFIPSQESVEPEIETVYPFRP